MKSFPPHANSVCSLQQGSAQSKGPSPLPTPGTATPAPAWGTNTNWSGNVVPYLWPTMSPSRPAPAGGRFPTISSGTYAVTIHHSSQRHRHPDRRDPAGRLTIGETRGPITPPAGPSSSPAGGRSRTFNVGTNQFFHVIVNVGVDPDVFATTAGSAISVAGDFTINNSSSMRAPTPPSPLTAQGTKPSTPPHAARLRFGHLVIDKSGGTVALTSPSMSKAMSPSPTAPSTSARRFSARLLRRHAGGTELRDLQNRRHQRDADQLHHPDLQLDQHRRVLRHQPDRKRTNLRPPDPERQRDQDPARHGLYRGRQLRHVRHPLGHRRSRPSASAATSPSAAAAPSTPHPTPTTSPATSPTTAPSPPPPAR